MKKLVMLVGLFGLLSAPAFALSTSEIDDRYGLGLDVVVYRSSSPYLQKVEIESKYDFENKEATVFAVATVDLFSAFGGK